MVLESACEVRSMEVILDDIEKWRKKNHITKTELATAMEMTEKTLSRLYNGERTYFTSEEIGCLCDLMNKPADFFIPPHKPDVLREGLKDRSETTAERVRRKIKDKCVKNDEAERRLTAAAKIIYNVEDKKKREILIHQVEGLAALAE